MTTNGGGANGRGALVLVATPIGNLGDLSPRAVDELRRADVIAAEDTRRARALLSHAGVPASGRVRAVHAHNERESSRVVVDAVRRGQRVAYVTDAGTPGVSDPGERLVRACLDAGLAVEMVPGPSAVLVALVLSGFPTDRFVFEGFLPRRGPTRRERLAAIAAEPRTTVVFEAPNRVKATLSELLATCGPLREVAIARELTKLYEEVWRGDLAGAVAHVSEIEPRGEHVVVLAPAPAPPEASDAEIEAHVAAALTEGLSTRDAAARVARDLHVPRRRVYDAATRLRRSGSTS
jgi:16S rRNA (cytidine1402-2'-O)-methyltransferase